MFFKDTNLLPRHTGVFFAIVILLVLLVLNFDKCYMSLVDIVTKWIMPTPSINTTAGNAHIENFDSGVPTIKKISVQVSPEKREAVAKFEKVTSGIPVGYTLKNYLLVLAKYNKDLVQVDSLNVKMSNELLPVTTGATTTTAATIKGDPDVGCSTNKSFESCNSSPLYEFSNALFKCRYTTSCMPEQQKQIPTTTQSAITTTTQANSLGGSICNNEGICSYVFTDLDTKDDDGNVYYYKLGVGAIYDNAGVDVYSNITTYNFGTGNTQQYFRVDIDMQEQEKLLRRLADIESASLYTAKEQKPVATGISDAVAQGTDIDAYMKMLRPYVGNYPDEFTLNRQKINELTLDSYLDENYAVGEFNVNVNLGNIMPAPTTTKVTV